MPEIARRAGLGVATVYRHFPSRQDLVSTVRATILRFGEQQVHDAGLTGALLGSHPAGAAFAQQRREHAEAFAHLVQRARAEGAVRRQVSVADARIAPMAITSFRDLPVAKAASLVRRLTDLLLAGVLNDEAPIPDRAGAPARIAVAGG